MKILYISKYVVLPEHGSPTRQYFISKFLSAQNDNKVLLIGSRSTIGNVPAIEGLYQSKIEKNLQTVTLNGPNINLGFNLKRIWSWIVFEINIFRYRRKIKLFEPDVIIVSSLSILTFFSGVLLKRWLKISLALEIRDIYPLTLVEIGNYSKSNLIIAALKWVEKFGYKNADLLISTLPNASAHFESVVKRPVNFLWLPMGIDPGYYAGEAKGKTAGLIVKHPGDFVVGYAGTLGKANALDVIFEAAGILQHSHPQIRFVFVGEGALKAYFQTKYENLANISFLPAMPKIALQNVLAECDILINTWLDRPIYKFGISPNKWMDYMYAGKPVLVAFSGYKCIIEEAGCGIFVPAQDSQSLVNGIINFVEMPADKLVIMGKNGKDFLISNLSYQTLAANLYQKLVSIMQKHGK